MLVVGPRMSRVQASALSLDQSSRCRPLLSGFESNGVVHLLHGVLYTRSSIGLMPGLRDLPTQDGVPSTPRI